MGNVWETKTQWSLKADEVSDSSRGYQVIVLTAAKMMRKSIAWFLGQFARFLGILMLASAATSSHTSRLASRNVVNSNFDLKLPHQETTGASSIRDLSKSSISEEELELCMTNLDQVDEIAVHRKPKSLWNW